MGAREYPSAPIVAVGAIVIEDDRVLLVRRNHPPRLGQWSVPGGAVELGEAMEAAVVREVAEETGLAISPVAHIKTLERIERDSEGRVQFHYLLIDFLCRPDATEQTPHSASDVSDARWIPLSGLRGSQEFILPEWTLTVIEEGASQMRGRAVDRS